MNSPYGGSKTDPHSCLDDTKGQKGKTNNSGIQKAKMKESKRQKCINTKIAELNKRLKNDRKGKKK